ncbi:hypothetical protein [Paraburkholderia lycopersici]|nr:hypothetical protein [Paraburkholderia lycopersici]
MIFTLGAAVRFFLRYSFDQISGKLKKRSIAEYDGVLGDDQIGLA